MYFYFEVVISWLSFLCLVIFSTITLSFPSLENIQNSADIFMLLQRKKNCCNCFIDTLAADHVSVHQNWAPVFLLMGAILKLMWSFFLFLNVISQYNVPHYNSPNFREEKVKVMAIHEEVIH